MEDWNDATCWTFLNLLKTRECLFKWDNKGSKTRQLQGKAIHDIVIAMELQHKIYLTSREIMKRIKLFQSIYSKEVAKIIKNPSYEPTMVWFAELEKIIKRTNIYIKPASMDETGNGSVKREDDDMLVDVETQVNTTLENLNKESTKQNEASASSSRGDKDPRMPHDSTTTLSRTKNTINLPTGGTDYHTGFGLYLEHTLLGQLPLDIVFSLQRKFMGEAQDVLLEQQRRKNNAEHHNGDCRDSSYGNVINLPTGGMDYCSGFGFYLSNTLLRKLPLDIAFSLERKFMHEAQDVLLEQQRRTNNAEHHNGDSRVLTEHLQNSPEIKEEENDVQNVDSNRQKIIDWMEAGEPEEIEDVKPCPYCKKFFESHLMLMRHMTTKHPGKVEKRSSSRKGGIAVKKNTDEPTSYFKLQGIVQLTN